MERILVTGGAGFVGCHLVRELNEAGYTTRIADRQLGVELCDPVEVEHLFDKTRPDRVVHLAARYGRVLCEDDPASAAADNVGATVNVARACGTRGIPLVYASSSEVYGDHGDRVITELSATRPQNTYGLTKLAGERACETFAPEGLAIIRFNMLYGPGQQVGRGRAAMINMLEQARLRQPVIVHRGTERSWLHVRDAVRAARMIVEEPGAGVFNVSRDDERTPMLEIAELACLLAGAPLSIIRQVDTPDRVTPVKRMASPRMWNRGWQPTIGLGPGITELWEWMNDRAGNAARGRGNGRPGGRDDLGRAAPQLQDQPS